MFAAGVLALESQEAYRIDRVIAITEQAPETTRGLISALGWVAPRAPARHGQGLPRQRPAAAPAARPRRVLGAPGLPGIVSARRVEDPAPMARARALRLVGELAGPS